MKLNGFSSGSDASGNNCFVLHHFVCQKAKISQDTSVQCELGFSQVVFSISSRRVEISFNGCENQSKEIHVLFVISEP